MDQDLKILQQAMVTDDDKHNALVFIDGLAENLYKTDGSLEKFMSSPLASTNISRIVLSLLPRGFENSENRAMLEQRFEDLKTKINSIKKINLTLAIQPDEKLLNRIKSWILSNYGENAIIDIDIKADILGGAIVIVDGVYHDFSLVKKLAEVLRRESEPEQDLIN